METSKCIRDELRQLGAAGHCKGYEQALAAILLALEDESRLLRVVSQIYNVVAAESGCGRANIERNIRTVSHTAWRVNPRRLKELAGYPLYASPTASEFISILAAHVQRQTAQQAKR